MNWTRVHYIDTQTGYAVVSSTTALATTLVASQTGKRIFLTGAVITVNTAMTLQFFSATTAITGIISLNTNGSGFVLPQSKDGWIRTNQGESLNYTPSSSGTIGGAITFVALAV